ncbi:TRAP transporter small permease [Salipiger abyssi]|uniref:TRAP transporter small permease n=1 Tax=Salipiger abyssi TaxID=1250539 RepID=UPI001A8F44E1|nr:TRAP transporter small permease [Salipiger abyssi]MBN9888184.1 TRAP transporter small permease [Salipiger abyssi]
MAERGETEAWQGAPNPLSRILRGLSYTCAGLGGLVIFVSAIIVSASVLMRNLGFGGIRGDFELVELACAACASLFLPLCQLTKGHVMVDLFTGWLPPSVQRRMDGLWTLVFAFAWAFLAWRLSIGLEEMHSYGDRTMLLRAPIWWVYMPAILGTTLSAIIAFVTALPMISNIFRAIQVR